MPARFEPDDAIERVTHSHVRAAADRLAGVCVRTPVLASAALDALVGATVLVKPECLQRVGAFKFRGALNALARLRESGSGRGVLAYSSGNHAQAIALAASMLRIPAVIVMPSDAPRTKLARTREYLQAAPSGSEVVVYDRSVESREALGTRLANERGLTLIPPYDHPDVIAGQGTAALEMIEDAGPLDTLFVPVGGGGLISGCAIAAASLSPGCRVIGVEPEAGDDATRSFRTGVLHTVENPKTICDGARTPYLGRYTFPLIRRHVADMMTVSDAQVASAMAYGIDRLKLLIEPTGALGLAGLFETARTQSDSIAGKRIGVLISGGNVDLDALPGLLAMARSEP
ncbi:MAG: threo-3-hydroxy-L-aspartate ammonia-lyase [Phycisphaerales bacterium]|nr:threo-3-hydroxy-L-aspartate ammonia-lyase [Phycisphaerales bacterium]